MRCGGVWWCGMDVIENSKGEMQCTVLKISKNECAMKLPNRKKKRFLRR